MKRVGLTYKNQQLLNHRNFLGLIACHGTNGILINWLHGHFRVSKIMTSRKDLWHSVPGFKKTNNFFPWLIIEKKISLGLFKTWATYTQCQQGSAFSSYSMAFIRSQVDMVSWVMDNPRGKADLEKPELNIYWSNKINSFSCVVSL